MADALRAGSANLFGKVPAWAGVLAFLVSRWLLLCFLVGFVLAVCLSLPDLCDAFGQEA